MNTEKNISLSTSVSLISSTSKAYINVKINTTPFVYKSKLWANSKKTSGVTGSLVLVEWLNM